MHRVSMTNAASSICTPLDKAPPKSASVDQLVEKMKSIGNHANNISSVIAFRNSSQMTKSSDLQRFFGGWAKVDHFPTYRSQAENSLAEGVNKKYTPDRTTLTLNLIPNEKEKTDDKRSVLYRSLDVLEGALAERCTVDQTISKKSQGTAELLPRFNSTKKGRAPLPSPQVATNATTNSLVVDVIDSGVSVATTNNKKHKKCLFDHLRAMWKRVDLPLIDILSPKY